ncbi:MAG: right-handed parallel beta-helix repeat-containing protein [bacterium]
MKKLLGLALSIVLGTAAILIAYVPFCIAEEIHVYPQESIQEAIDAAYNEDKIIIHEGIYYENINFLGKIITVRSTDPDDQDVVAATIIDGKQEGSVVTFDYGEGSGTVLKGVTIQNGNAENGGGIFCQYQCFPTIDKCIIIENAANTGGGIFCSQYSSPAISNCIISGNSTISAGGGIVCSDSSSPYITNCIITENSANGAGGGISCSNSSSPLITNCTIAGNSGASEKGGGISCSNSSSPTIINCILWNHSVPEIFTYNSSPHVIYSNIRNTYAGEGNISINPSFLNATSGDYHLQCNSPCIDAGIGDEAPDIDIDGLLRPLGAGHDMGACEFDGILCYGPKILHVNQEESIQEAINTIYYDKGEIIVHKGIYFENIDFLGKSITIKSIDPNDPNIVENTIVNGGQAGSVITFTNSEGSNSVLSGITIRNGSGIYCRSSSPTITHCIITENSTSGDGGGIYCHSSSPTITHCIITENSTSGDGGGIYCHSSSPTITHCIISENSAGRGGGGIYCAFSSPTITSCSISHNLAQDGGGIFCASCSLLNITNCIIADNSATSYGGGIYCGYSTPIMTNCTISGNSAKSFAAINCQSSTPILTNCIISEHSSTYQAPIYIANSSSIMNNCTITMNSNKSQQSIISFYRSSSATLINCILWNKTAPEISGSPQVTYSDIRGGYQGEGNISMYPSFVNPMREDYHLRADSPCIDAGDPNSMIFDDKDGNLRPGEALGTGYDIGAYEFEGSPCIVKTHIVYPGDTIQEAINAACSGDEIIVHRGTYYENINFLGRAITVRSANPYDPNVVAATIIDGNQAASVVTFDHGEDKRSVLSGLTLQNGNNSQGGGIYCYNYSSPTITECVITKNSATNDGGGLYCYSSSPNITNCAITDNLANIDGGGIYSHSSFPIITNCTITDNSATNDGGGIYCHSSSARIVDCTIAMNSANRNSGGLYCHSSSPAISNCILWDNSAPVINIYKSSPTITYSNIRGGYPGKGNISIYPSFVSLNRKDYHLRADSPCIDAGDPNSVIPEDKDGHLRPMGAGSDIGAYEFDGDRCVVRVHDVYPGDTIQEAINAACSGDEIIVHRGTYYENINFSGRAITVRSANPHDPNVVAATIIDGDQAASVVTFDHGEDKRSVLSGITLQNGNNSQGGGIYCYNYSSPSITNCIIMDNSARSDGGGIFCDTSSSPRITNCIIVENSANQSGGGIYCHNSSSPSITNGTIVANSAGKSGGGIYSDPSSLPAIINCILWDNSAPDIAGSSRITYSNIRSGYEGKGNLSVYPAFININAGDYHLRSDSPCIDAGDPNSLIFVDKDGHSRPMGAGFDIGAFEFKGDRCMVRVHEIYPEDSIQEAINSACNGDEIIVHKGAYYENINFLGKIITVSSINPDDPNVVDATIIDGSQVASVVTFNYGEDNGSILSGFTLQNGNNASGGGIFCSNYSSPTISNCIITENKATSKGGGIFCSTSSPSLINCLIEANTAPSGGGMYCDSHSSPTITNCIITENTEGANNRGYGGGIYCFASSPTLINSLIKANSAYYDGGGIYCTSHSSPRITNCTITENSTDEDGGGIFCYSYSSPSITNSAIVKNTAKGNGGAIYCNSHCSPHITNCTLAMNSIGYFGGGIFCANFSSPTFINSILWNYAKDDINLYWGSSVTITYSVIRGGYPGEGNISTYPSFIDPDAGDYHLRGDSPCIDVGDPNSLIFEDKEGNSRPNGAGYDIGAYEFYGDYCQAEVYHVYPKGSIQEVISAACSGAEIIVHEGIYYENIDFFGRAITVRSTDPNDPNVVAATIIDGNQKGSVITFNYGEDTRSVLSGFTLQNGNNSTGGGILCSDYSSPTIANCIITENIASKGGGIYCHNHASPTIANCITSKNEANEGGGIYCYFDSSPTTTNCVIAENVADMGGGIYCDIRSAPIITNCTIAMNLAKDSGGGIYCDRSSLPTIINSILWNSSAPEIYGTPTVTYSDIRGGYSGEGNISLYPSFVNSTRGNYHLQSDAPCIDAADPNSLVFEDKDGHSRPMDAGFDMGAYEFDSNQSIIERIAKVHSVYPEDSIQEAINAACSGDEIIVYAGTYFENINFLGKAITVRSANPNDPNVIAATIIDGNQRGSVITFNYGEDTRAVLSGFTVQNGNSSRGGGILCSHYSSPTITNCIISSNFTNNNGGGILCSYSAPLLANCIITENSANNGAGIYCFYSSPTLSNCTIVNNSAHKEGGGIFCDNNSFPIIINCIFWRNPPAEIIGSPAVTYSDITGGYSGVGNISLYPMFENLNTGDYHLRPDSPCIDTGDPNSLISEDIDGNPRPSGEGYDMGAYEYKICDGDLNEDGHLSPLDASIAFECYLGGDYCSLCADINKDGKVTPLDALCIFKKYLEEPKSILNLEQNDDRSYLQ